MFILRSTYQTFTQHTAALKCLHNMFVYQLFTQHAQSINVYTTCWCNNYKHLMLICDYNHASPAYVLHAVFSHFKRCSLPAAFSHTYEIFFSFLFPLEFSSDYLALKLLCSHVMAKIVFFL